MMDLDRLFDRLLGVLLIFISLVVFWMSPEIISNWISRFVLAWMAIILLAVCLGVMGLMILRASLGRSSPLEEEVRGPTSEPPRFDRRER